MLRDATTWRQVASVLPSPLTVIDVGARGGLDPAWSSLAPHVRAYGFEPDRAECERLNRQPGAAAEYVPLALWSTRAELPFYVTEDPLCSCVFPPLRELADDRPRLALMRTREHSVIAVQTLQEWAVREGVGGINYLKLDAQGAELAILQGADTCLREVRAIKIEVQFNALYEGVPLFGEVDAHLRARGFALWRLGELSHCGFAGTADCEISEILDYDDRRVELAGGPGQLLWANAYYVRSECLRLSAILPWEDAVRDACLAWVHGYEDLAEVSLRRAVAQSSAEERLPLAGALNDQRGRPVPPPRGDLAPSASPPHTAPT